MTLVAWRMLFWDGSEATGSTWDEAVEVAEAHPDDVLARMLYYEGGAKQVQMGMEYYFVAPHPSGEPIYGTGMDAADIEARYPGAIVQRGKWAPDGFYRKLMDELHAKPSPCGCS